MLTNNILKFLFFLSFILMIILSFVLIVKHRFLYLKHDKLLKYLYNYLNVIISARYGNLVSKCDDGTDELTRQLSKNTNMFLESVVDRDLMIKEYIEKEKESQNLKQDFISSLAHDLKVPIIAQDNTYDLFLNGSFGEVSDIQINAIKNLKVSNNDLKNLIVDLLDAHKLEKSELELNKSKTELNGLINEIIEQIKSIVIIQNKEIIFQSKLECAIADVDSFLIKRVVNNLISNAIVHSKATKDIKIVLDKSKNYYEISVIDEGEGIKESEIKKIFAKYYTGAQKYSNIGVGLGLYIANKIIVKHGGKIKAKNNTPKGAIFTIMLPIINN